MTNPAKPNTAAMTAGRRADTQRRRERVQNALNAAASNGLEISASTIARQAGVDRTFLYRHRDLLEQIHAAQVQPTHTTGPAVSRASLQADLLASHERAIRLSTKIQQLEQRLSEKIGEQTWRESGLGAPTDIDHLNQQITTLEQRAIDLQLQLQERNDDLQSARAANRDLMAQLNAGKDTR